MNNFKNLFATLSMVTLLSFSGFSIHTPNSSNPSSVQEQISDLLQGIEFTDVDEENTVLVDFILTDRNEIMILSTNSKNFDGIIKARLNYKKIKTQDLERNKTYTVPVRFAEV